MGKYPTNRQFPILYSKLHEKTNESPLGWCGIIVVTKGNNDFRNHEFKGVAGRFSPNRW
jgi:hypothetical protein